MMQRVLESFVIVFSAFVLFEGDWVYETFFPERFWEQKWVALQRKERRDLWRLHREEWHLKQAYFELSFALSAAEDEAECFALESGVCTQKVKAPFLSKIASIEKDLEAARESHKKTLSELKETRKVKFLSNKATFFQIEETPVECR